MVDVSRGIYARKVAIAPQAGVGRETFAAGR